MNLELSETKLQDRILSAIVDNTNYPLFEIGQAYKRLKSFDKLLACIDKATQEKRSLEGVVDVLMEGRQCVYRVMIKNPDITP